jgi:DNA (cytosine-5)-methyltransferase 1
VSRLRSRPSHYFGGGLLHPDEDRHLTTPELKRVASFPDAFELLGTARERWGQVGNSVPPFLARAVVRAVLSVLRP